MRTLPFLLIACGVLFSGRRLQAQEQDQRGAQYLEFVREQAADLRSMDYLPPNEREWRKHEGKLREELLVAWGGFPKHAAPLKATKLGELPRDGYKIEKITFQTLPGVFMTANTYVPNRPGKFRRFSWFTVIGAGRSRIQPFRRDVLARRSLAFSCWWWMRLAPGNAEWDARWANIMAT